MNKQIIFVDSTVKNYESLVQGISSQTEVVILDSQKSGIEQISNFLSNQTEIDAIHILSHGSEGNLKLGSDSLNKDNINRTESWGKALTETGDILLYGCDVGAGEIGLNFVNKFSQITGADVAASNNKTGSEKLGADWDLEIVTGNIETSKPFIQEAVNAYDYVLANFNVTAANDDGTGTVAGTLSKAIFDANTTPGDDTITLQTDVTMILPLNGGPMKTLVNSNIDFIGNGKTISGYNTWRPLFIKSGTVNLSNLTIANGKPVGGSTNGGGGGAGMGGGLFIYDGSVGLINVTFNNNKAIGGNPSDSGAGKGGGGMGGSSNLGGGGLFASANSRVGAYNGTGNYGGFGKGGDGGDAVYVAQAGGFGGGGGGSTSGVGALGGFGGGGGASSSGNGNNGGYGGGGSAGTSGGAGGNFGGNLE